MALPATPRPSEALRPSLSVVRDRKADRRTETDDLRMEVAALHAERHQLGLELGWLSRLLHRAVLQERDDLAMEASGRLDYLAGRLMARGQG